MYPLLRTAWSSRVYYPKCVCVSILYLCVLSYMCSNTEHQPTMIKYIKSCACHTYYREPHTEMYTHTHTLNAFEAGEWRMNVCAKQVHTFSLILVWFRENPGGSWQPEHSERRSVPYLHLAWSLSGSNIISLYVRGQFWGTLVGESVSLNRPTDFCVELFIKCYIVFHFQMKLFQSQIMLTLFQ